MIARRTALVALAMLLPTSSATAQGLSATTRAAVADTIRREADRFIAAIGSRDITQFIALFTDAADLVYVDNGKIYADRNALATAAGGFFKTVRSAGGRWDPAHVLPLSPTSGAFTGIFRPQMVDTAGKALWTDGKIWTFVYERRGERWVIVQAHEVNARKP